MRASFERVQMSQAGRAPKSRAPQIHNPFERVQLEAPATAFQWALLRQALQPLPFERVQIHAPAAFPDESHRPCSPAPIHAEASVSTIPAKPPRSSRTHQKHALLRSPETPNPGQAGFVVQDTRGRVILTAPP